MDNLENYVYVNENDVDDCLICSICMSPFVNPIFCRNCKGTLCWREAVRLTECPFCRIAWKTEDDLLAVPNIIGHLLDKIPVYCHQRDKSDACYPPMKRSDLPYHVKKFHPVSPKFHTIQRFGKNAAIVPSRDGWVTKDMLPVRWYECQNGHPYCVGECGMPIEFSRCPDCNLPIGAIVELDQNDRWEDIDQGLF